MGRVHQINTSNGGVPKLAVDSAVVDASGVVGDEQADKVHHGSPDQALCLYSLEVLESLRSEGHSIAPGSAGENITVSGLDWQRVVPGTRMKVGPVEIEITYYATPCAKNAQWFKDGTGGSTACTPESIPGSPVSMPASCQVDRSRPATRSSYSPSALASNVGEGQRRTTKAHWPVRRGGRSWWRRWPL